MGGAAAVLSKMKIKKTTLYMLLILILVVGASSFLVMNSEKSIYQSNSEGQNLGETQKVLIGLKNGNYYPNTINVKANQQVEISLDASVQGCLRDFTIPELGLRKYLRTPQDSLIFTPTKLGIYRFACSMGMGTGTLVVEE